MFLRVRQVLYPYVGGGNNKIIRKDFVIRLYLVVLDKYSNNQLIWALFYLLISLPMYSFDKTIICL